MTVWRTGTLSAAMWPSMFRRLLVRIFISCVMVGIALGPAAADPIVIQNAPSTGNIAALGEYTPFLDGVSSYYAQTFVTPATAAGTEFVAETLTFFLSSYAQAPGPVDFGVLLVGADLEGSPNLNSLLFESPMLTLAGESSFTQFSVNLGGTLLLPNTSYAWVLDAFRYRDGTSGLANVFTRTGFGSGDFYALNVLGGERSAHVLQEFLDDHDTDLAFELAVTAVPEPSTLALTAFGIVFAYYRSRRRPR